MCAEIIHRNRSMMMSVSSVWIFTFLLWAAGSNAAGTDTIPQLFSTEEFPEIFRNAVSANAFIQCIQSHPSYELLPLEENYINLLSDRLNSFVSENDDMTKIKGQVFQDQLADLSTAIVSGETDYPQTLSSVYDVLTDCISQNTGQSASMADYVEQESLLLENTDQAQKLQSQEEYIIPNTTLESNVLNQTNMERENAVLEIKDKFKKLSNSKLHYERTNNEMVSRALGTSVSPDTKLDYEMENSLETIELSDENGTQNSPSPISLFAADFLRLLSTSEIMENAFDNVLWAPSSAYYDVVYDYCIEMNMSDPISIATMVSNTITSLSDYMSSSDIAYAFAVAVGQYLDQENILTLENYSVFSDALVAIIEDVLQNSEAEDSLNLFVEAIFEGIFNFLKLLEVLEQRSAPCLLSFLIDVFESVSEQRIYFGDQDFLLKYRTTSCNLKKDSKYLTVSTLQENALEDTRTRLSFSEYVLNQISSEISPENFELNMTTTEIAENFYNFFYNMNLNFGMDHPEELAEIVYRKLRLTSHWLKPFSYVKIFIKSLENFLNQHSVLNPENTEELSSKYFKALKQADIFMQPQLSFIDVLLSTTYNFIIKLLILEVVDNPKSWISVFLSELDTYKGISLFDLISDVAPEVLSSAGLFSDAAEARINDLESTVATDILSGNGTIQISDFMNNLSLISTEIYMNNSTLKPVSVIVETFLEGTLALISVLNTVGISSIHVSQ